MAHVKISQMPALPGAPANSDVIPLVRGNVNYRVTFNQLRSAIGGGGGGGGGGAVDSVNGQTGDVVLVPSDIPGEAVVGGNALPTTIVETVSAVLTPAPLPRFLMLAFDDNDKPILANPVGQATYATSGAPTSGFLPTHGSGGRLRVGTPVNATDATTKGYVDSRLSAAQRSAIDALTSGSSAADIVAALKAV